MKKISIVIFLVSLTMVGLSQKKSDWKKDFSAPINWYKITDAGTILVGTKDALYGISPSGQEVWKDEDTKNINKSNVELIDGTPYVALVRSKLVKGYNKVIDVYTGKMVANTEDMGLQNITKRLYLKKTNRMLFYGPAEKSAKPRMVLADLTKGEKVWEQTKIFDKAAEQMVSEAGELSDGILIATDKNIYKLNNQTGEIMFTIKMKSDLPVVAEAKLFSDKGKSAAQTATSADFFPSADPNKFYFWNQDYISQFDANSGAETWTRFKLPSPMVYILHDSRGMLVVTAEKTQEDIAKANSGGRGLMGKIKQASASNKNRASLILIDPQTGKPIWDGKDVDLKGDMLAYKLVGNKLILGTQIDRGDNFISIVDLDAGKSITKKPIAIKGDVQDLQLVPQGIYFRTTDQINILNIETGEKNWAKGFKVKNCLGINEDEKGGYVYGNGNVYRMDFTTGDINEIISSISFDGGEEPSSISLFEDKIFISSDQNTSLYDKSGKLIHHTYVNPPGRTMGGKILSGLGGAAALAMGAAATARSAQLSYAKGYYGSTNPALDREIKNYQDIGTSSFSAASDGFKSISRRFNATKQANGFVAMLTKFGSNQSKDAGITIVNKIDGNRMADFVLGDKKSPDYQLDELEKMIYYKSENSLEGFKF